MSAPEASMGDGEYDILLDALKKAAAAHGIHEAEELGGVFDAEWPEWYTHHMVSTLAEGGYRLAGPAE